MKPFAAIIAAVSLVGAILLGVFSQVFPGDRRVAVTPTHARRATPAAPHRPAAPTPTGGAGDGVSSVMGVYLPTSRQAAPSHAATAVIAGAHPTGVPVSRQVATALARAGTPKTPGTPGTPIATPAHPVHPAPPAPPAPVAHGPASWLIGTTLLTVYGRAFGVAPILGRLGMDNNFADLEWQIQPYAQGIKANNGGTDPRIGVHLIYAMATPCSPGGSCLAYLDDAGVDIVKSYIQEAARRHWLVILDDQLGLSDPLTEVKRMIARGYLKYDNVEVALDPEFRATPGQADPGIPIGSVTAAEINGAQEAVNAYAAGLRLPHRKIVLVHQFQQGMIANRATLRSDLPYIDPVVVADGFGPPALKARIYSELLGRGVSSEVKWRGIKLFPFNPYENAGHGDDPLISFPQLFGHVPTIDVRGQKYYVRPGPNVIIIT